MAQAVDRGDSGQYTCQPSRGKMTFEIIFINFSEMFISGSSLTLGWKQRSPAFVSTIFLWGTLATPSPG
jgi:hypothetical protein